MLDLLFCLSFSENAGDGAGEKFAGFGEDDFGVLSGGEGDFAVVSEDCAGGD